MVSVLCIYLCHLFFSLDISENPSDDNTREDEVYDEDEIDDESEEDGPQRRGIDSKKIIFVSIANREGGAARKTVEI